MKLTIAIAAASFALGGSISWIAQSVRHDAELARIENERLEAKTLAYDVILTDVTQALNGWQTQNQTNEEAYAKLETSLAGLRSTVTGMRGELSTIPRFIESASRESLGDYAATCTDIFNTMAKLGSEMGHAGAGIARAADRHAADAQLNR